MLEDLSLSRRQRRMVNSAAGEVSIDQVEKFQKFIAHSSRDAQVLSASLHQVCGRFPGCYIKLGEFRVLLQQLKRRCASRFA